MQRERARILGVPIDALNWEQAVGRIVAWGQGRQSRYVCICNVHSVVTASRDRSFLRVIDEADMATPDGMPVAWALRRLGYVSQARINGPDLMWRYCGEAERLGQSLFLYGATETTLQKLEARLRAEFPRLRIAGTHSPPFRPLSRDEDRAIVERINASGAGVVFVGLGCPKQEIWMAGQRGRIDAVMVGVGAAFDYHAGIVRRAPLWMQNSGLEWLHRLASEPRRLWHRYLTTNVCFVLGLARQLLLRER